MRQLNTLPLFRFLMLLVMLAICAGTAEARAAKVIFVSGYVTAVNKQAEERVLHRNDWINQGDRVKTRAGRAQLRFTDGGLVSLEPKTVYRVDRYHYEGKTDGSERGFFSLVRGAFRAITGKIGKVRHENYKVDTPVAVLGVRGTHYIARLQGEGDKLQLQVSVLEGRVALSNETGEFIVNTGQSAIVGGLNKKPQTQTGDMGTPSDEPGTGDSGDNGGDNGDTSSGANQPTQPDPFVSSNQVNSSGQSTTVASGSMVSGPGYAVAGVASSATPYNMMDVMGIFGCPNKCGNPDYTMTFDSAGQATRATYTVGGALLADSGTTTVQGSSIDGILGWGRWTNGTATFETGSPGNTSLTNTTFSGKDGFHYLVGTPTPLTQMPTNMTATYTLVGATQPTFSDGVGGGLGSGTVQSGTLYVDFAGSFAESQLNLAFTNGNNYTMSMTGSVNGRAISLSGNTTNTQTPGSICGSTGCYTLGSGFFAGPNASHAGMAYQISAGLFKIDGVAAFKR